ncbi:MAG: hypothetical protein RML40_01885 [Bacteroidota bacterium]|nr:hypothetical protein [Bacteroidota bacterium]
MRPCSRNGENIKRGNDVRSRVESGVKAEVVTVWEVLTLGSFVCAYNG